MSSAISAIRDPISSTKKNLGLLAKGDIVGSLEHTLDPGGIFDVPDTSATMSSEEIESELTVFDETEADSAAADAATQAKKKKKEVTQTVLTSPLGSTETARTAVTKLGGR